MHKVNLSGYIREKLDELQSKKEPGPYITISRGPGCEGYAVGDLLLEKLNKRDHQQRWRLFKKEILRQLAEDTSLTEEIIEKERYAAPNLLRDFFRGISRSGIPDGYEIRSKITTMVRTAAFEGYAIIIGQGGTAATADIDNGLSVRLEAPKEWRMIRVARRDNLTKVQAFEKIREEEEKRTYLRKIYEESNPRIPPFNLMIDNSIFSAEQIAEIIFRAMELKNMIAPSH